MKVVVMGKLISVPALPNAKELLENAGHTVVEMVGTKISTGAPADKVAAAVGDADAVICGLEPYGEEVFAQCPNLKLLSRRGIGYDAIDLEACKKHNIAVVRSAGAVEGAVAEHVMAYLFYFGRQIDKQNAYMQEHRWKQIMTSGLKTSTLGLVGFGGIGKEIAKRAVPMGMRVLYNCRHPQPEWEEEYGVTYAPLDELLAASDYVSANVPLTESTRGMFNAELFAKMKSGSYFINIARGPVAVEQDLADAVQSGHLKGAAVDVFASEPCTESPLHNVEGIVLTPHTASLTLENLALMSTVAAQNVVDALNGTPDPKSVVLK